MASVYEELFSTLKAGKEVRVPTGSNLTTIRTALSREQAKARKACKDFGMEYQTMKLSIDYEEVEGKGFYRLSYVPYRECKALSFTVIPEGE